MFLTFLRLVGGTQFGMPDFGRVASDAVGVLCDAYPVYLDFLNYQFLRVVRRIGPGSHHLDGRFHRLYETRLHLQIPLSLDYLIT